MSLAQVASQIVIIFALMLLGALIREAGFLHETSINDLTNIILYFLSPMVILHAFYQPFSTSRFIVFLKLVVAVFLGYLVTVIVTKICFRRITDPNYRAILMYGSIYFNNGFMGIPLAQALFGIAGVFYGVASMIGFNVMSWTQGIGMFHHSTSHLSRGQAVKKILLNPNIIAILVGLLIFAFSVHLPSLVTTFLTYGSQAFTPLSMMIIGSNLVGMKLKNIHLDGPMVVTLLFRNLLFPLINLVILILMGIHGVALLTTVILAACPVAGLVVLFTLQAMGDTKPAVVLMSLSTILSLVTIPIVYLLTVALVRLL